MWGYRPGELLTVSTADTPETLECASPVEYTPIVENWIKLVSINDSFSQ